MLSGKASRKICRGRRTIVIYNRLQSKGIDVRLGCRCSMKCYVINLAGSPERLAHMRQAFATIGVEFERFEAIDAARSTQHPALPLIPALRPRPWTAGELACLLSHYEVWKLAAASPEPFTAIFEDDLHIDPRLADLIRDPAALPPDADLVKLETVNKGVSLARGERPGPAGTAFALLRTLHDGAGAYVVSRRTAELLVGSIASFDLPVDDVLFGFDHPLCRHLRRYQILPALAVQDVILAPEQRTPLLGSELEPDRVAARRAEKAQSGADWQQSPWVAPARAIVHWLRRSWGQVLKREIIVPFSVAGKTVGADRKTIRGIHDGPLK